MNIDKTSEKMLEWNEKLRTLNHYDQQSAIYDVQYAKEQKTKIETAIRYLNFKSKDFVLDLGCGTGFLFEFIDKKIELLVGIDISLGMLREAKKRKKNLSNTVLIRGDTGNLPIRKDVFNTIFAITLLQNIPKPSESVLEMKRVSKSQCQFAMSGLKKKFTKENFIELLETNNLIISNLITNQQLKGYIAICSQLHKNTNLPIFFIKIL